MKDDLGGHEYELLAPIAAGGMASVWAARLRGAGAFQKIVAVKTMLPALASEPEYRAMFFDEARVASKLRHPNVCQAFGLGEANGALFLAMEWVDGISLHRLLRPDGKVVRPIAPALAARILAGACSGLHAAHEATDDDGSPLAIVHRDVSPQNVLVSTDGHVKVADFGVAKALGKSHSTQAGQAKGKLAYMAPEQLRGQPIDRRADVFALGCVLYEITTGAKPFDAETDAGIMQAILRGVPTRPSELVAKYPVELERIVARAMARDPRQRFASAEGLRLALERWLSATREEISERDIATLVHERCHEEIDERRAKIRAALTRPSRSLAVEEDISTESSAGDRSARRQTLWLGALVIAIALGSLLWKQPLAFSEHDRAPPPMFETVSAIAVSATARASAPAGPGDEKVRFLLEPANAILVVDGEPLEAGVDTVARPEASEGMKIVLVKAPDHVDRVFLVDHSTPVEVEAHLAVAETASAP